MELNNGIRKCRMERNLTQEELADVLGMPAAEVKAWEAGKTCPDARQLPRLARALGTDLNTLFGFSSGTQKGAADSKAAFMKISECIGNGDFERAEELLGQLPGEDDVYRNRLEASLCLVQGKLEKAAEVTQRSLLTDAGSLQASLMMLLEIYLKGNRAGEARETADILSRFTLLMQLREFGIYAPRLMMSAAGEDGAEGIKLLDQMVRSMTEPWDMKQSVLYCHLPESKSLNRAGSEMMAMILSEVLDPANREYEFLRREPGFWDIIDAFEQNWGDML